MKRFYFYKRNVSHKKEQIIDFNLQAFYSEKAYFRNNKEIERFNYLDNIDLCLTTNEKGIFRVKFDSGKDGCMVH